MEAKYYTGIPAHGPLGPMGSMGPVGPLGPMGPMGEPIGPMGPTEQKQRLEGMEVRYQTTAGSSMGFNLNEA